MEFPNGRRQAESQGDQDGDGDASETLHEFIMSRETARRAVQSSLTTRCHEAAARCTSDAIVDANSVGSIGLDRYV